MYNETPLLIVIAGPTAVGKSKIAIKLAKYLKTEIISFQAFYKELNIDTNCMKMKKKVSNIT